MNDELLDWSQSKIFLVLIYETARLHNCSVNQIVVGGSCTLMIHATGLSKMNNVAMDHGA